ncbi:hypothetical protein DSY14_00890 [Nocardiopsis sp. MG754419]|nr:hypothetical protein [Nocardiopsis sp. MG754419]
MDRIERRIDIAATAERVWALVSEPGWFLNEGTLVDHRIEDLGDGLHLVHDPTHGEFRIRTEKLDAPHYAAFRWISRETGGHAEETSTLVEFRIEEAPGGVTLTVVESGFSRLGLTEERRRERVAENTEGWGIELAAARRTLDPESVERSVHVAVTPERLWSVLTEPRHFAAWYAFDGADFEPREGASLRLRWDEHGDFHGRIVTVDAPRVFAYRIALEPGTEPGEGNSTLVTFRVRPSGNGSLLTVAQVGFVTVDSRFGEPTALAAIEREGWDGGLTALLAYLGEEPR